MKKKLVILSGLFLALILVLSPVIVSAQTGTGTGTVSVGGNTLSGCESGATTKDVYGLLCTISKILNSVIPILIALGVVYFVWGVVSYVIASDEEAKKSGRDRIIYGIIGLAVIVSVWGLVNVLVKTLNLESSNQIVIPTLKI